jgi:hypothetical protein
MPGIVRSKKQARGSCSVARAEQEKQAEKAREKAILGDARSLTLKQDDGTMDGERNIQGALYTLQFETPKKVEGYVWQVQIYASQFGGQHNSEEVSGDVYILDENANFVPSEFLESEIPVC